MILHKMEFLTMLLAVLVRLKAINFGLILLKYFWIMTRVTFFIEVVIYSDALKKIDFVI